MKFKINSDHAKINEGLIILNKLPKLFYIDFIDSFYEKKFNVINFIKKKIIIHYLKFNWRGLYDNYFKNFKTINRLKRFDNIKDSQKILKISEVDTIFKFNIFSQERECYHYGFYVSEISETFLILNILNRYKNFIDVGANLGFYSYLLSNYGKRVFAFEPNPYCFYKIKENKYLRKFKIGLADKKEKKLLNIKSFYSGGSTFNVEFKSRGLYLCNAKITTLDDFAKDYNLKKTLIKIDCEGFENYVLKGGTNILKKYKPDIIIDIRNEKQFDTLKNFNYKIYPIIMKPENNQYILAKQMKNFYVSKNVQNAFCVNYNFKKMQNLKIDLKIFTNPSILNEVIDEFKILKI